MERVGIGNKETMGELVVFNGSFLDADLQTRPRCVSAQRGLPLSTLVPPPPRPSMRSTSSHDHTTHQRLLKAMWK